VSVARVEFHPEAFREIEDALEWYLERSLRAAEAFEREVESGISIIASSPAVWPLFEGGARRYILRRFPYSMIYRATESGILIVALAHHKRRPRYWRGR
jgi:toxin ParE1/3/4